jgi:hypothetical protein
VCRGSDRPPRQVLRTRAATDPACLRTFLDLVRASVAAARDDAPSGVAGACAGPVVCEDQVGKTGATVLRLAARRDVTLDPSVLRTEPSVRAGGADGAVEARAEPASRRTMTDVRLHRVSRVARGAIGCLAVRGRPPSSADPYHDRVDPMVADRSGL